MESVFKLECDEYMFMYDELIEWAVNGRDTIVAFSWEA
jgi:hypothetical protein